VACYRNWKEQYNPRLDELFWSQVQEAKQMLLLRQLTLWYDQW